MRTWISALALIAGGVFAWNGLSDSAGLGNKAQQSVPAERATTKSLRRTPPVAPDILQIDAQVAGEAPSTATLVLHVGQVTTTQSIQLPAFSVTISGASPDDMVSVEVLTGDAKHAAILGSYGKLARYAGADAVLTADELDRVRLRAMSTSLHFYVSRELGARLPTSDREHELAIRSVGSEVAIAGSLLDAFANGTMAVPEGYAHGYALLEDQPGFRRYLRENPQALDGYRGYMTSATGISFPVNALGTHTALMGDVIFGEPAIVNRGAQVIAKVPGGYEMHVGFTSRDPRFTVNASEPEAIELTPQTPAYYHAFPFRSLQPGGPLVQVLGRYTNVRETYRRHFIGDRYSLWGYTSEYVLSFPNNPELPPEQLSFAGLKTAINLDNLSMRFWPSDVIGRRALPYFCGGSDIGGQDILWDCEYAQHTFQSTNIGVAEEIGMKVTADMQPTTANGAAAFTWRLGPRGRLQVDYEQMSVTYWRIDEGDEATDVVIYLAKERYGTGFLTLSGHSAIIDARTPSGFESLDPLGTWVYATWKQQQDSSNWSTVPTMTRFVRSADGISMQIDSRLEPTPSEIVYRSSWQVLDGRLYDTRYQANVTGTSVDFASCEEAYAAGATLCRVRQVRYFRPLARIGQRLYGIEDLYQNAAGYGQPPIIYRYPRATYYEKVPQKNAGRGIPSLRAGSPLSSVTQTQSQEQKKQGHADLRVSLH